MKQLYIPLALKGDLEVLLFEAVSKPAQESGEYRITYSVCVKKFDDQNPSYSTSKHEVYSDYMKTYRNKVGRKGVKAEKQNDTTMLDNLEAHLSSACLMYGVSQPLLTEATESFTRALFDVYKEKCLGLDIETQEIIRGFQESLEFTQDHLGGLEEVGDEAPVIPVYPFQSQLKIAKIVSTFCNQLQIDGRMDELLSHGIPLDRIGNCLYYGVRGHGTGFFDEDGVKDSKELLDYLDGVMQRFNVEPHMQGSDILLDVTIDKQIVKG
ncbi:MAG: hypothetical protein RR280_10450 [Bacteroidaceae bacterium]